MRAPTCTAAPRFCTHRRNCWLQFYPHHQKIVAAVGHPGRSAGSSAILRPSVLTQAISSDGAVVQVESNDAAAIAPATKNALRRLPTKLTMIRPTNKNIARLWLKLPSPNTRFSGEHANIGMDKLATYNLRVWV